MRYVVSFTTGSRVSISLNDARKIIIAQQSLGKLYEPLRNRTDQIHKLKRGRKRSDFKSSTF